MFPVPRPPRNPWHPRLVGAVYGSFVSVESLFPFDGYDSMTMECCGVCFDFYCTCRTTNKYLGLGVQWWISQSPRHVYLHHPTPHIMLRRRGIKITITILRRDSMDSNYMFFYSVEWFRGRHHVTISLFASSKLGIRWFVLMEWLCIYAKYVQIYLLSIFWSKSLSGLVRVAPGEPEDEPEEEASPQHEDCASAEVWTLRVLFTLKVKNKKSGSET